jgi:hypothetical protein
MHDPQANALVQTEAVQESKIRDKLVIQRSPETPRQEYFLAVA